MQSTCTDNFFYFFAKTYLVRKNLRRKNLSLVQWHPLDAEDPGRLINTTLNV